MLKGPIVDGVGGGGLALEECWPSFSVRVQGQILSELRPLPRACPGAMVMVPSHPPNADEPGLNPDIGPIRTFSEALLLGIHQGCVQVGGDIPALCSSLC